MYRKTYVEIDLDTIENNIRTIKSTYPKYKYYIGVVKNNAYGHGTQCINAMIDGGINYLAVSSLEEALEVRKINAEIPILIIGRIPVEAVNVAAQNNITIMIDDVEYFEKLINEDIKIKFHLKIDSGMNRFGIKEKEKIDYIVKNSNENLYLEGIYTHIANGVENNPTYKKQIETFKDLTSDVDLNKIEMVHLDRSLTMETHEKLEFANGVRVGISMYGFANLGYKPSWKRKFIDKLTFKKTVAIEPKMKLNTAFLFKTQVIETKNIKKGDIVGYDGAYEAKEDMKIALLSYGFADFLYNDLNYVVIHDKKYKIISINMDITTIEIDENVNVGDEVEVFGNNISIRQKANEINQNSYKILTSITSRVPRIYKRRAK